MIKILIITSSNAIDFYKYQLPNNSYEYNNCRFYVDSESENNQYDYCFVMDEIDRPLEIICDRHNVILSLLEPPIVKRYNKKYLSQFERVSSFYPIKEKKLIDISYPLLPWMVSAYYDSDLKKWFKEEKFNYNYLIEHFSLDNRKDKIVAITSNKTLTKGHRQRLDFIYKLKSKLGDKMDIYGSGFTPIKDKYSILEQYKYALVMENTNMDNYWTEKIADAYLAGCYPFYWGCANIREYLNPNGMEIIKELDETSLDCIEAAINNDIYRSKTNAILNNKMIIMEQLNLFHTISSFVNKDFNPGIINYQPISISPMKYSRMDHLRRRIYWKYNIKL